MYQNLSEGTHADLYDVHIPVLEHIDPWSAGDL